MNLHDVMADNGVLDDTNIDGTNIDGTNIGDASGDTTILDDERFADELAGTVEIAAAFLASADAAALAQAFAAFTCGIYSLDQLAADLWRLGAWIRANA
jgi:hypothetical protein